MSKCLRCSFPRDEPKGNRTCKKCGRNEAGTEKYEPMQVISESGVTVIESDFLPSPVELVDYPQVDVEQLVGALPEHSPLGASCAERWTECSGSVELIRRLGQQELTEEPDYRAEGTQAHALAAYCLDNDIDAWEAMGAGDARFPLVTTEMALAVQVYIDYVRARPGRRRVEVRLHRPDIHPLAFGTVDAEISTLSTLEIIDYKHGIGVVVHVHANPQLMYYAAMALAEDEDFPDDGRLTLTIVQPRAFHSDGQSIHSWETTAGFIRAWVTAELRPAMEAALDTKNATLSLGKWCQFCPAKLVCPAMSELARTFAHADPNALVTAPDKELGERYAESKAIRFYLSALEKEVYARLLDRKDVPGAKLVFKRVDRVWKDEAEDVLKAKYGPEAFTMKLVSPAVAENFPDGKTLVAEYAFKPEAGYTIALADDERAAVVPKSGSELFANAASKYLVDSATE